MTSVDTFVPEADERVIRDIVALAADAQGDSDALIGLHTPGAVIVNLAGRRVLGRDEFAAAMRAALASSLRKVRTAVEILDIRLVASNVAIVSCMKRVHDERPEADRSELPAAGALTYVMIRSADGWSIALAQTTPIAF